MIGNFISIVKMIIAILPFVVICFSSRSVNLPKSERSRQFLIPIVTVVYAILAMLMLDSINDWLIRLINNIPKWIAGVSGFSWMPEFIGAIFKQAASLIERIVNGLNLNYWIFFVSNSVIIAVYLVVKKICLAVIEKTIVPGSDLHLKIAGNFYEYFAERSKWCIKENYVQARNLLKVFFYSSIIISSVLMLVSQKFYLDGLFKSIFYPVFGVLTVGELFFYLDGMTKREYSEDVLHENEDAYKIVNYSLLRKFLRSIFGDKLLSENTSVNNDLHYEVTTDEIIRDLEKSEDAKVVNFAGYIKKLSKTGFAVDHNYLFSSLDMLNGKSILFNNPFYNDLIPYAFYPMNRALLSHKKVLIVLGRHAIEKDIEEWVSKGIEAITNIPFLWNIGVLNHEKQDLDIGIVTRSAVLDMEIHNVNSEFLEQVGFFVVIEPSKLLSTAQIGLNLLVKKCRNDDEKEIVYCLCDKNCDGLVDAMSHALMTSITEVSATKKHLGTASYMCWEADDEYLHHRLIPNISRYLGVGTELSFAALKNQVSKTKWYGGEAFPVTDIRWIDRQYYYDLTKYAGLPTNQEAMDEHFCTSPNFWSAETGKNNYITVEDESNNMFEILRDFSTRTTEQGFINVISSEYLLKDYMAYNAPIFEADAKAIPYIVADYTRSNRNAILRLVLLMSTFPVSKQILEKELSLLSINVYNLKKQLWYEIYNCYSEVSEIANQPSDYKEAVDFVYTKTIKLENSEWKSNIIRSEQKFNLKNGELETVYLISDKDFLLRCVSELRSAGYVAEDEKGQKYFLGSELSGHIYQKYLPGQFFTFDGKYYEMQYLTADGQVLVRRAADHINGRLSYRQIREYTVHGVKISDKIGSQKNVAGLKIVKEFADISVITPGYYRMTRYNDFKNAKCVSFEGEKNGIPKRVYRNKEILRIELPNFDDKFNNNVRYTIATLFNEIFKTIFAENQGYICALTDTEFLGEKSGGKPLSYFIKGDDFLVDKNSIYIVEDSQLDLGLTVAVERNLERILGIIYDYLDWHLETLENSLNPPPEPQPPVTFEENPELDDEERGISAFFNRLKKKIKDWFDKKRKKKGNDMGLTDPEENPTGDETPSTDETPTGDETPTTDETPTGDETPSTEETPTDDETPSTDETPTGDETPSTEETPTDEEPPLTEETPRDDEVSPIISETESTEYTDKPVNSPDINELLESPEKKAFSAPKEPYHEKYYLLFGAEGELSCIDVVNTLKFLESMGFGNNSLKQARTNKDVAALVESTFNPGKPNSRYCDFCGAEIYGVEYETLSDGRDRCISCGKTSIKTEEEFRALFADVKRNMESFYGIRINAGIKVEMVNAKKLHKSIKKSFTPTKDFDGRVMGVAISDKNGYTLMLENGSPRMEAMLTIVHELTHIWQYINWDERKLRKKYGKNILDEVYEGMSMWAEIQYAYLINEPAVAKRHEIMTLARDDIYGRGFIRYRTNYPFSLGTYITKSTPFMNTEEPLDMEYCGAIKPANNDDDMKPTPPTGSKKKPIEDYSGAKLRDPEKINRYAYEKLSGSEKTLYEAILDAINNFKSSLDSLPSAVSKDAVFKIVDYLHADHPEIFWFNHGATLYYEATGNIVNKIDFTYCMSKEEAISRKEKIDSAIKPFLSSITSEMSDYEVTLRVYENIIKLVDYDTIGLEKQNKSKVTSSEPDDLRSIYGVFVNKKAVCAGYAKAFQYLINLFGIECVYIVSDTHAWNLIKLEGDYYHIDVTWGDGSNTKKEKSEENVIYYDCFCVTTEEIIRLDDHLPEKALPLPTCTATKCNYFRRHGLFFEKYDYEKIREAVCGSAELGKNILAFKFANDSVYKEARKALVDDGKIREAVQFSNLKSSVRYSSSYSYTEKQERLILTFYFTQL